MTKKDKQKIASELRAVAEMLSKHSALPKVEDVTSIEQLKEVFEKSNPSAWRRIERDFDEAMKKMQEDQMGEILE